MIFNFEDEFFRGILEVLDSTGELVAVLDVQISWEAIGEGLLSGLARQTMERYASETDSSGDGWSAQWLAVEGCGDSHEPTH